MTGIDLYMQHYPLNDTDMKPGRRSHFGHVATLDDVPLKVMDTSHKYWRLAFLRPRLSREDSGRVDGYAVYVRSVSDPDNDD